MDFDGRALLAKISALPPTLQMEVIRFVNFLSPEVEIPAAPDKGNGFEVEFVDSEKLILLGAANPETEFRDI